MSVFYAAQFEQAKSFKYDFNKYESIRIIGPFTGKVFAGDFSKLETRAQLGNNSAKTKERERGRNKEI